MKEPIYKVSCIVIGSKCTVMRSTEDRCAHLLTSTLVYRRNEKQCNHRPQASPPVCNNLYIIRIRAYGLLL